tara:strand:+ start:1333 stop:1530 length:198 start_codon:yes stop_codon:yes gene_type:complete
MEDAILEKKIENIESELKNLKSMVIGLAQEPEHKKVIKLKGLLKGIVVNEEDIKEAEKALFKTGA